MSQKGRGDSKNPVRFLYALGLDKTFWQCEAIV